METKRITDPETKSGICERVLRALPDWFGMEEGILGYIGSVRELPFWAVAVEGADVGFIALSEATPSAMDIHVMGVLPEFHRRSIGREPMETVVGYARDHGYPFLTVKTLSDRHPDPYYARTRLFYTSMGFMPLEYQDHWGPENPCVMMAMAL